MVLETHWEDDYRLQSRERQGARHHRHPDVAVSAAAWVAIVVGALLVIAGIGVALGMHLADMATDVLGEDQDVGTRDG